ncbi:hypothetical protein M2459_001575 [Parabacteroides sp. PF5-5]|uniref:leucine-rich repeat domain-containing protein n=1 Tax=unclassified Parabacteroides TaxID=2649774 RepID=UPI0024753867|nr:MULTISPECIES: leucine-rich repeat domain-containing protein [unclassified Parabacteroides]MDH6304837.1 hypothetical protein [Parabacteroides sp. PH5-39]MDH6316077.1 hypothetical protein [Parabacteroides sp. PF5-13]MDH6319734.1 hypothetical protein [Parabacteroides sp. PH5-13]MDH6323465.1 hypothetical protein [Parabacteroides sp. PH5-8]MDH6327027.1 hypothetical protein [Parabacteroides sp. PH5-41]
MNGSGTFGAFSWRREDKDILYLDGKGLLTSRECIDIWDKISIGVRKLVIGEGVLGIDTVQNNFHGLEELYLPASVEKLNLTDCSRLQSVSVHKDNNHYTVENNVLFNKNKTHIICCLKRLQGTYHIPDTVTSIGSCAFSCCSNLTKLFIPESVVWAGPYAFSGCCKLEEVYISEGMRYIADFAFQGCHNLKRIYLPITITGIGFSAFEECLNLNNIYIPDSVTSIGWNAFKDCEKLSEVYISKNIQKASKDCFLGCHSLKKIVIPNNFSYENFKALGINTYACALFVHSEFIETYRKDQRWDCLKSVLPVTEVTQPCYIQIETSGTINTFSWQKEESTLYLEGKGMMNVRGCMKKWRQLLKGVKKIVVCEGIKSFNFSVLEGRLTEIEDVEDVEMFVKIYLPASFVKIVSKRPISPLLYAIFVDKDNEHYASRNGVLFDKKKNSLICCARGVGDTYRIPNTVKSINRFAFWGCDCLRKVIIPESVSQIQIGAFSQCGIQSIRVPNSISSISKYLFAYNKYLTKVSLGDSVTSIGEGAFLCCESLSEIYLSKNITTIEKDCFWGCSNLKTITIGNESPCSVYEPWDIDYDVCKLYVPSVSIETYKNDPHWGKFKNILPIRNKFIAKLS